MECSARRQYLNMCALHPKKLPPHQPHTPAAGPVVPPQKIGSPISKLCGAYTLTCASGSQGCSKDTMQTWCDQISNPTPCNPGSIALCTAENKFVEVAHIGIFQPQRNPNPAVPTMML